MRILKLLATDDGVESANDEQTNEFTHTHQKKIVKYKEMQREKEPFTLSLKISLSNAFNWLSTLHFRQMIRRDDDERSITIMPFLVSQGLDKHLRLAKRIIPTTVNGTIKQFCLKNHIFIDDSMQLIRRTEFIHKMRELRACASIIMSSMDSRK